MLKFLGSLFIVSSMTGIGIWKAEEVKHSYQALGKIYHLIGMMKNELSYAGSEFGEMFECLGRNLGGADRQMQIWSMERYLKQIELQMDEMRKDIQMRMKVRICLGASAGILITIFLI